MVLPTIMFSKDTRDKSKVQPAQYVNSSGSCSLPPLHPQRASSDVSADVLRKKRYAGVSFNKTCDRLRIETMERGKHERVRDAQPRSGPIVSCGS